MTKIIAATLLILGIPLPVAATGQHRGCGGYTGRAYVICKESGVDTMPNGLPPGTPHPGPSSASGPCGMTRDSRADYGGDTLAACNRYRIARYKTWANAEDHHRKKNWW